MPETIETEIPVETEEHVENPAAVLKKNRELLSDIAKMRDRAAALEDLARDMGLDAEALADPRAAIARRGEESKAARERERVVREAVFTKIHDEGRHAKEGLEAAMAKVLADPGVKLEDGKVTGLDAALSRLAPKKAAPGLPDVNSLKARPVNPPATFEALQALGSVAASQFALAHPKEYGELRADFERKLASGAGIK